MGKLTEADKKKINEIIEDKSGVAQEEVIAEANLYTDLGADSLDFVELVMDMEKEFDINIPDEVAEEIKTVQQLYDAVESQIKV